MRYVGPRPRKFTKTGGKNKAFRLEIINVHHKTWTKSIMQGLENQYHSSSTYFNVLQSYVMGYQGHRPILLAKDGGKICLIHQNSSTYSI